DAEHQAREERRVRTALRLSSLPTGQSLADFDFAFQPAIERSRIDTLATCSFIRGAETVLIQGPPGVGKTHLAVGLGGQGGRARLLGPVLPLRRAQAPAQGRRPPATSQATAAQVPVHRPAG